MKGGNMSTKNDYEMKDEYDFSQGVRGRFYKPHKKSTTIRLDDDIILFFKKKASEEKIGYQTLLNSALREYIKNHAVNE
ncbi:BrnA antitoxin family protein [Acidaminobacter sp. JC074]|nr:BrnA antitoxin family protein [Acidaminobacter sp. JC074]